MLQGYAKTGKRIIGTYDLIPATALLLGRNEDGELEHDITSEVFWDGAEMQTKDGQIIFVDENYNHVLESDVEWRPEL